MCPGQRLGGPGQGHRHEGRQNGHAEDRPDAEQQDVEHTHCRGFEAGRGQDQQRGRSRKAMGHPDQQGAPRQSAWVIVIVFRHMGGVGRQVITMRMRMQMNRAVRMAVPVKMHPLPDQAIEDMGAQRDQHDAYQHFQESRESVRKRRTYQDGTAGDKHQCHGMTDTPDRTMTDDLANGPFTCRNAGNSGYVIGF